VSKPDLRMLRHDVANALQILNASTDPPLCVVKTLAKVQLELLDAIIGDKTT
jgi:hypothetical protein